MEFITMTPCIGDLVIVRDKHASAFDECRNVIQEGIPYTITSLGYGFGNFYISVLGKNILLTSLSSEYIDVIYTGERPVFMVGDHVMITHERRIDGGYEMGFREGLVYEVKKIYSYPLTEIVITNGKQELWVRGTEMQYIKSLSEINRKEAAQVVEKAEKENIKALIDKALDEKDFETFKKLTEME